MKSGHLLIKLEDNMEPLLQLGNKNDFDYFNGVFTVNHTYNRDDSTYISMSLEEDTHTVVNIAT